MKARGSKLKMGADLHGRIIAVTTLGGLAEHMTRSDHLAMS
jgi:hypothetical protein